MKRNPRHYQMEAVAAAHDALAADPSALIVLPTGTGKTVVMAHFLAGLPKGKKAVLLADRVTLLDQAADKFSPELGYKPPIIQADRDVNWQSMFAGDDFGVVIASVQSARSPKRLAKLCKWAPDYLLIDEAHHATSRSHKRIIRSLQEANPALSLLGVTATPKRADGKAMGQVFSAVAYQMTIGQAIEGGWLVEPFQGYVKIEGLDFSSIRTAVNHLGEGDLNADELEKIIAVEQTLHAMAKPYIEQAGHRQGIFFTPGKKSAHMLAEVINRYMHDGAAVAVDGETPHDERTRVFGMFAAGQIRHLVNCAVLTEGFDAPAAAVVGMGRPTKSPSLYIQMLGRVLRPEDGLVDRFATPEARRAAIASSSKPLATCLDFVGNTAHADALVSVVDVLGGDHTPAAVSLAKRTLADNNSSPKDAASALEDAEKLLALEAEIRARKEVRADHVAYTVNGIDPFGPARPTVQKPPAAKVGDLTSSQLKALLKMGVSEAEARGYSKAQAGVVLNNVRSRRCSVKQKELLLKYGEETGHNYYEAKRIIDEIASNGWKPRKAVPA